MINRTDLTRAMSVLRNVVELYSKRPADIEIRLPDSQHRSVFDFWRQGLMVPSDTYTRVFTLYGIKFVALDEEPERLSISHWGKVA